MFILRANTNVSQAKIVFCAVSRAVHAQLTPLCPSPLPPPPSLPACLLLLLSPPLSANGLGGCGRRPDADTTFRTRSQLCPLPLPLSLFLSRLERFCDTKIIHFQERSLNLVTHVEAGRRRRRRTSRRSHSLSFMNHVCPAIRSNADSADFARNASHSHPLMDFGGISKGFRIDLAAQRQGQRWGRPAALDCC